MRQPTVPIVPVGAEGYGACGVGGGVKCEGGGRYILSIGCCSYSGDGRSNMLCGTPPVMWRAGHSLHTQQLHTHTAGMSPLASGLRNTSRGLRECACMLVCVCTCKDGSRSSQLWVWQRAASHPSEPILAAGLHWTCVHHLSNKHRLYYCINFGHKERSTFTP